VNDNSNRVILDGLQLVCEIPRELGHILYFEVRGDRLIVHTARGIKFIHSVPREPPELDGPQAWDL
jgi:hypothetical protein